MERSKKARPAAALALMAFITLAALLQLDATGGTVASHEGALLQSLAPASGAAGAAPMATVRRSDGSVVQAPIARGLDVHAGEEVVLAGYRRLLSPKLTYRVVARRDER